MACLLTGVHTTILQSRVALKRRVEYRPQLANSHLAFSLTPYLCPYLHVHDHIRQPTLQCQVLACLSSSSSTSPPSTVSSTKLYVSGLSFRTTHESLRNAFQQFGQLEEVNLVMDRIANRPRGFAFLRYATEEESKNAIEGMHGKFLDGRVIFVEVAKPRTEPRKTSKSQDNQNA